MKRIFLVILTLFPVSFCVKAQNVQEKIEITGAEIVRSGDEVSVTFCAQTKKNAVKGNFSYALSPVVTNGEHQVSFPTIVVRGKRAARVQARNEKLSGRPADCPEFRIVPPGVSVDYSASVPFQQWMEGAMLVLESSGWGCCSSETYSDRLLSDNILPPAVCEKPIPVETAPPPSPKLLTTGDTLALTFSFVIPESEWNEAEPIYDEDREKALVIYFRQNGNDIRSDYENNQMTLINMSAAIQTILESPDSQVSRIIVAGYSSPEGPFRYNDRLAWERAVSVKEYIMKNTGIPDNMISLHNGSEDWRGLRAMVAASDLRDKAEILQIIDTVPILSADGLRKERLQRLKDLNGGVSYRYMANHFFPRLRNGAFIRVYYTNNIK